MCIDAQYDFLDDGKLPVKGSTKQMDSCTLHLLNNDGLYTEKFFTCDFHPHNHSSFVTNGGEWPIHCVNHTKGAAIYEPLINAAFNTSGITTILTKGCTAETEEYSVFDNAMSKLIFKQKNELNQYDEIHVCGIVGTICVKNSIIGLMQFVPKEKIVVLTDYVANFDDGTEFKKWLTDEGIKFV